MCTAERRANGRRRFELGAGALEVRRRQHDVIDVRLRIQNGAPTARQRKLISGVAASNFLATRWAKSFRNSSSSSIVALAMKSVRFRSSTNGWSLGKPRGGRFNAPPSSE